MISGNNIKAVNAYPLARLKLLASLDLSSNQISSIDQRSLKNLNFLLVSSLRFSAWWNEHTTGPQIIMNIYIAMSLQIEKNLKEFDRAFKNYSDEKT